MTRPRIAEALALLIVPAMMTGITGCSSPGTSGPAVVVYTSVDKLADQLESLSRGFLKEWVDRSSQ